MKSGGKPLNGCMMKTLESKSGFTMVEIMLTIVLVLILVLGGGAVVHQTGSRVVHEGNKRVAIEIANLRMEMVRAQNYDLISPGSANYYEDTANSFFLTDANNDAVMERNSSKVSDTITLAGNNYAVFTEIKLWGAGGSPDAPLLLAEHIEAEVTVQHRSGQTVSVKTRLVLPDVIYNN
jgi:prepilin-type N-terminal cleavage/methylation domain-containing protein